MTGAGRSGPRQRAGEGPGRDRAYWEGRHRRHLDIRAVGYRSRSPAFNRWMYRVRDRTTNALLDRLLAGAEPPIRVLDVGSGSGFYAGLWSERPEPAELVGLDLSPEAVEDLSGRFPGWRFRVADVGGPEDLPDPGPFDVVECFDVLYHITGDLEFRRALERLGGLVRPGGHLLVTDNFPTRDVTTRPHVRLRSLSTYMGVLTGFRCVEWVPQFLALNVPSGIAPGALRWPLVLAWEALTWPARYDTPGHLLGAALYGLDRILLPLTGGRTPSTVLAAFRKTV